MGIPLTHNTYLCPTLAAHGLEGVFRIKLGTLWDKLAARRVRAEDAGLPRGTILEDCLQELGLVFSREYRLDHAAWYRLRATSWWHLRFFGRGLVDHDT